MKTSHRKRISIMVICLIMIVSSMNVWARYYSAEIGVTTEDKALCELYGHAHSGEAYTTPAMTSTTVQTKVYLEDEDYRIVGFTTGTTRAYLSTQIDLRFVWSSHKAGPYSTTLADILLDN